MLLSLMALAGAAAVGEVINHYGQDGHYGGVRRDQRPLATGFLYPPGMVDDVRRPGYNGRLWVGRPIIGGIQQGPYAVDTGTPGTDAYGAFGADADPSNVVYARVCHLVVGVDPWQTIPEQGYSRYEHARNFWLKEQGYTGGVRTFVNDLNVWKPESGQAQASTAGSDPTPRATIQLPADMPRQRRRIRVDAGGPAPAQLVVCPGEGPARISWPMAAPERAVARTATGMLITQAPTRVVSASK